MIKQSKVKQRVTPCAWTLPYFIISLFEPPCFLQNKAVQQYQIFLEVVSENLVLLNRPVFFKTQRFNSTKFS